MIVATHIDQEHLHNHLIINSVSFIDGKKYYGSHKTYRHIREVSDCLCQEHGLSVVENPEKTGKDYSECHAEKNRWSEATEVYDLL